MQNINKYLEIYKQNIKEYGIEKYTEITYQEKDSKAWLRLCVFKRITPGGSHDTIDYHSDLLTQRADNVFSLTDETLM